MFKLVIVEDEDNIRHSLETYIPWEQMGFQVVAAFSDGSDALAYLTEHPCDVVLTDILMSRMSGLEMIRRLHEIQPQIKVVILSGHSDFAYAQQAIQYKVVHYLVKPVDEDELMSVFKGIAHQLDDEREELTISETETRDMKQLLQKSFLRDLLSGRVTSDSELCGYLKLLGLEDLKKDFPLFAYELKAKCRKSDDSTEDPNVEDVLKKQLDAGLTWGRMFLLEDRNDLWRIIFISPNSQDLQKLCNQKMQMLTGELNAAVTQEYTFHLTHSVMQLGELLGDTGTAPEMRQEQQMDGSLCESVVSDYRLLIVELDLGSTDTLVHILKGMLHKLKDTPLEDVRFVLKNLYSVVELEYKKRKLQVWELTEGKFDFNHLYRARNLETVAACIKEDFCALCEGLKHQKPVSNHGVVGRLVQYLNEHLDEDIAHDEIAARYRIHPGYLSRLFKQEMGETLSEYLLRIRIERAAGLLKEGHHKIGEIAGMVGYSASSYFSIMFKKFTGYSPREYTQRISL